MITKRTVALVVGGAAVTAWFAAATTSGVRPVHPIATAAPAIDLRGAALSAEIERLHERLKPTATPDHGRNLFEFAARRASVTSSHAPAADVIAAAPAPAAPVEPPFKLIGIAEDRGTRTAILSTQAQLLMVHDGDNVLSTYRVTGISADTVELTAADGNVLRLALK